MSTFRLYLELGFQHISDLNGYDHILFLVALCAIYTVQDWKKLLVLVTAFTVGHSVTLALSTLDKVSIRTELVEFLIPITILFTCVFNYFQRNSLQKSTPMHMRYASALFFGLIHGLGFSTYLKSLLGKNQNIVLELLAFNIGLELGQLIIVFVTLLVAWLATNLAKIKQYDWILLISGAVGGISLMMISERWVF
ncbi:MAG: HupE/UreJ family protein [Flammeovirgaceae bacterium]|nr:HupE/UreJ family protein [Flammeovirgaceae bacterium]MDW8287850.1 HupE/UreJ family protein [Flammeovirgaceae bacterium]